ncbi:hypothetical protein [Streptomyces sp. SID8358]|uniref:hypothetical protein n=1 Tax=Streptomyces sp. SID8358 TaxID=2690342 RepID=UPI001926E1C6|nr:hypothetical protein [Streptomyces sp. SID8358]
MREKALWRRFVARRVVAGQKGDLGRCPPTASPTSATAATTRTYSTALDPYPGRFVVHGPPAAVLEGGRPGGMVLIEGVGPGYGPAGRAEKLRAETEGSAAPPRTDPPQAGGPWE